MLQRTSETIPLCFEATVTSSPPLGPLEGWYFLPLSFISSLICKVVRRYRLLVVSLLRRVPPGVAHAWGAVLSYK